MWGRGEGVEAIALGIIEKVWATLHQLIIPCICDNDYFYLSQWLFVFFTMIIGIFTILGIIEKVWATLACQLIIPCPKEKHSKQQVQKKFDAGEQDWCCWWSDTISARTFPILAGCVNGAKIEKSVHRVHKVFIKRRQVGGNKCWVSTACFASCVRGHRVRQVVVWGLVRQVADRWFVAWSDRWLASRTDRWLASRTDRWLVGG